MKWETFPPPSLRERFLALVDPVLRQGDRVVVAFSGGGDSTFLLWMAHHLVKLRGIEPIAAYLNHGQRPDAAEEEAHVRKVLRSWGHPCVIGVFSRPVRKNVEHTLRKHRYRFLQKVRRRAEARFILTAHTADDVVETLLLQIARGGGGRLPGIPWLHRRVLRPMLLLSRDEVRRALEDAGFAWYEDPSNRDPRMLRNRFREVLPLFPSPVSIARDALLRQEMFRKMEARGGLALSRAFLPSFPGSLRLDRTVLAGYDKAQIALALASRFPPLRRDFWMWGVREGVDGFREAHGLVVWDDGGELWVGRSRRLEHRPLRVGKVVLREANLVLKVHPASAGEVPEGQWVLRGVEAGDRMGKKKLSELLRARGVPRWAWPLWPVVARKNQVIWALGIPPAFQGPGYTIEVNKHEPESFGISDLTGSPS